MPSEILVACEQAPKEIGERSEPRRASPPFPAAFLSSTGEPVHRLKYWNINIFPYRLISLAFYLRLYSFCRRKIQFIFRSDDVTYIAGLQLTSRQPCWWIRTKRFPLLGTIMQILPIFFLNCFVHQHAAFSCHMDAN